MSLGWCILKGVLVRELRKGVSGKPYPRLCNARRPRLEPGTFRSQAVRLYRLHQARPSKDRTIVSDQEYIFSFYHITCLVTSIAK